MTSSQVAGTAAGSDPAGEEGASPITAVFGLAVFLTFLLLAVQVLLFLFTASVAQAAAVDGASFGAGFAQTDSLESAEDRARQVLGGLADTAVVDARLRDDLAGQVLVLSVEVDTPSLLTSVGLGRVTREAEIRVEQ